MFRLTERIQDPCKNRVMQTKDPNELRDNIEREGKRVRERGRRKREGRKLKSHKEGKMCLVEQCSNTGSLNSDFMDLIKQMTTLAG